jgi:hypothetical protein
MPGSNDGMDCRVKPGNDKRIREMRLGASQAHRPRRKTMAMATEGRGVKDSLEPYDPKRLIRQVMELDEAMPTSARDCIVLWLMSLADHIDPAEAARRLLEALPDAPGAKTPLAAEMVVELEEVARFPRRQLLSARPARRTGRRRAAARSGSS